MTNGELVGYLAGTAWLWGWLVQIWKKLKAVDVKIELLQASGQPVVLDVRVGGRRRYDPPAPGDPPKGGAPPESRDDSLP